MTTPRRYLSRAAALLLASGLVAFASVLTDSARPAIALASTGRPLEASAAPQPADKLMVVLDSSGSMAEPAGGGQTRIEAARQALNATVDGLPEQAQVGMRVYGATVESKAKEPTKACQDSQAVVPIGTDNRAQLRKEIGAYKPFGETPTAYALRQAAKDLGSEGRRSIVLVSDGEENCHPDPCQVSADLAKQGIDLKIDVVGFNVNDKARKQLQCIADKGNGSYYDAKNADDLTAGLDKLSSRAFRPFEFTGKPVELAEGSTGAPELRAGQYLTTLAAGGQDRYAVIRKKPGSSLWISGTTKSPVSEDYQVRNVEIAVSTPEGDNCGFASDSEDANDGQSSLYSSSVLVDPLATIAWSDVGHGGSADRLLVKIRNGSEDEGLGDWESVERVAELLVIEEPAVPKRAQRNLPGEDGDYMSRWDQFDPPWSPSGKAKPTVGGSSFSNATTLAPGTYSDTILPGESLTYRVPLQHGQHAEFLTRFAVLTDRQLLALPKDQTGLQLGLSAFGPSRDRLASRDTKAYGDRNSVGALLTPQVRYLNRDDDLEWVSGASMAGYYYFTVQAAAQGDPVTIPFELDLKVKGEPHDAPAYESGGVTGPVGGDVDQGEGAPERPGEDETATNAGSASSDKDENDGPIGLANVAVPAGIGLLLVVGVVVAGLLIRRPRNTGGGGPVGAA